MRDPVPTGIRRGAYLPELESLRGIAILLVFAYHADAILGFPFRNRNGTWPPLPLAFVWGGRTGVSLFFVLSAFLLSRPFFGEAYGGRHVSRREFYVRRALRILPLFYTAVAVATVSTSHHVADLLRAMPYLAFVFVVPGTASPMLPFNAGWWSLAVEVQFYVLLPVLALAFGRARSATLGLMIGGVVCWAAVALRWLAPGLDPFLLSFSVLGRAPLFVSGIVAAWIHHRHGDALRTWLARHRWWRRGGADLALVGVVALLGALLRWHLFSFTPGHPLDLLLLLPEGVLWGAALLGVLVLPVATKPLVSNRFLRWLGVLSYSIYLTHFPILHFTLAVAREVLPDRIGVSWGLPAAVWVAIATGVCLAVSSLTYRYIERPFLARKAGLGDRERPA